MEQRIHWPSHSKMARGLPLRRPAGRALQGNMLVELCQTRLFRSRGHGSISGSRILVAERAAEDAARIALASRCVTRIETRTRGRDGSDAMSARACWGHRQGREQRPRGGQSTAPSTVDWARTSWGRQLEFATVLFARTSLLRRRRASFLLRCHRPLLALRPCAPRFSTRAAKAAAAILVMPAMPQARLPAGLPPAPPRRGAAAVRRFTTLPEACACSSAALRRCLAQCFCPPSFLLLPDRRHHAPQAPRPRPRPRHAALAVARPPPAVSPTLCPQTRAGASAGRRKGRCCRQAGAGAGQEAHPGCCN